MEVFMGRLLSFSNHIKSAWHTLLGKIQYWGPWKLHFSLFSVRPLKESWPQGWHPYNTLTGFIKLCLFYKQKCKGRNTCLTDLLSYTKNKIIIILCDNSQQLALLIKASGRPPGFSTSKFYLICCQEHTKWKRGIFVSWTLK